MITSNNHDESPGPRCHVTSRQTEQQAGNSGQQVSRDKRVSEARSDRNMSTAADEYKPPDGGWGWVVVVAAHISIGFAYSTPKALSIFFKEIQEDLEATFSEIALLSSIMLAVMYAGVSPAQRDESPAVVGPEDPHRGPLSGVLVSRFGSRPIVIVGGLMCGFSMVTASFGNSIVLLYLCIGIIGGFGLAFNLNASLTIISKYFLAKRPLANGLAMAGSPVFLCFLAPLNQCLQARFGWRGSLLVLGALMLNCCVAGALMRPVTAPCKPRPSAPQKKVEEQQNDCSTTELPQSCLNNAKTFVDLSFFKDRGFVIYLIGNVLFIFGAYAPIMFLPAYAISRGVDEYSAAYLLSVMGFVDMFIRPTTGLVANSKWVRPRIQYFFSFAMVFNGMCHLLCPLMEGYSLLVVYAVFHGMGFGMVFAVIFECLMDLMGSQRFPRAVGLVTIIECFPMLLGPPAAAFLVDLYDDYKYLFFMCGAVIVAGGLFLFVMNIYSYHMQEKETRDQVSISATEMKETHEAAQEKNGGQRDQRPDDAATPHLKPQNEM